MSYSAGDSGHIQAHTDLVVAVNIELERFGLPDDLPLKNTGDEGHLDDHNAIVAALTNIESTAGQTYSTALPPTRNLGDPGHPADHSALEACVAEASSWPAFNAATVTGSGATQTIVDNYNGTGEQWEVWTILPGDGSDKTFTPTVAAKDFRFLVVGGGGGGGSSSTHGSHYGGLGGSGAAIVNDAFRPTPGQPLTITVGNGGGQAGTGGASTFAGVTANPGTGGANCHDSGCNNGTSGGPGVTTNIQGNNVDQGFPYKTTCCPSNACSYGTWAGGAYGYGGGGHHASVSSCAPPGLPGVVIIAWPIGPTPAKARRSAPRPAAPLDCGDCQPNTPHAFTFAPDDPVGKVFTGG